MKLDFKDIAPLRLRFLLLHQGKRVAFFAGGIIDEGNGSYSLINKEKLDKIIEEYNKYLKLAEDRVLTLEETQRVQNIHLDTLENNLLFKYLLAFYSEKYLSISFVKELKEAVESSSTEYIRIINKKIEEDMLVPNRSELESQGIKLTNEERSIISTRLEKTLKNSCSMDLNALKNVYNSLEKAIINK